MMTWQQIVGVVNILLSIFLVWTLLRSLKVKRLLSKTYQDALDTFNLASRMQAGAKSQYDQASARWWTS